MLAGAFTLMLAEGSEAISAERTEAGSGAFGRVVIGSSGTEAAGGTDESAPWRCLAAETGGETVDRFAAARDRVGVRAFPAGAAAVPESAADTEASPVSAPAIPVVGT
ncbi:MAG: hypothetical protein WCI74_06255 [Actinomycetes bacterium]